MDDKLTKIIEYLKDENFTSAIGEADIKEAKKYAVTEINQIHSDRELFIVLASINLLNSAIKRKEYKRIIVYSEIKNRITRILNHLINRKTQSDSIKFFINPKEKCAYIEILGIQFSFHHISMYGLIPRFLESGKNNIEEWKGLRLQRIAGELFRYGLEEFRS